MRWHPGGSEKSVISEQLTIDSEQSVFAAITILMVRVNVDVDWIVCLIIQISNFRSHILNDQ